MNRTNLALLSILAMISLASWVVGNELLSPGSKLLSLLMTVAYPASLILGAGALAGATTRASFLKTSHGLVSLKSTGIILMGVLLTVAMSYNHGGALMHNLCWYCSFTVVGAYTFLLIMRGGSP
jgi:hypothetical protein